MALLLTEAGFPFVREHKFHPTRRWRFDFAIPEAKVAVEIEGGIYTQGRHTRGSGFSKDCEKYNAATVMGWAVLRYPANEVGPEALQQIKQLAGKRYVTSKRSHDPLPQG